MHCVEHAIPSGDFNFDTDYLHNICRRCQKCTLFLGAVGGVVTIQNCSGCRIIVACARIRIINCTDLSIFVMCSDPPVFFGDNRAVSIGPYNAAPYLHQGDHVDAVGLARGGVGAWDECVDITGGGVLIIFNALRNALDPL